MQAGPTPDGTRLATLDVLRGVAICGIFVMNVQDMGMPQAAYVNPHAWGRLDGLDGLVWALSHGFADLKFVSIFSLLFGTGLALLADRRGPEAGPVLVRRQAWLFAFGLLHAYGVWAGDILTEYALLGFAALAVRDWPTQRLVRTGAALVLVAPILCLALAASTPWWPAEVQSEFTRSLWPDAAQLAREIEAYRGGWWQQMDARLPAAVGWQTEGLFFEAIWRSGGLMLVGLGLFRTGFLQGRLERPTYLRVAAWGFGSGGLLLALDLALDRTARAPAAFFLQQIPNLLGSLGMAAGYVAATVLLVKSGRARALVDRLAAVGQLAFTNYLAQSLVGTALFYGHGLGLFARVERSGQALIVLGMWALQLGLSPLWLRYFRFGPFEWAWRCLTYRTVLPMRRVAA